MLCMYYIHRGVSAGERGEQSPGRRFLAAFPSEGVRPVPYGGVCI